MTKTHSLAISLTAALIGFAAAGAPAQAATRLMGSSIAGFEYRCERHGGAFGEDGSSVMCQTPTVAVECEYFAGRQAVCNWPGIENQIAVIRVIGTLPPGYSGPTSDSSSQSGVNNGNGGGGGGGFQGPKDIKDAPNNDPKPNFDGPQDFEMAP